MPLCYFTFLIGIIAAVTDSFAAAWTNLGFLLMKWVRQTADRTLSKMALVGLREQSIITYFSHSILACFFMLWSMQFLTPITAIFHEVTCTLLECHIIHRCFAARGTYLVGGFLYISIGAHDITIISLQCVD
jgi:hypothetical protein